MMLYLCCSRDDQDVNPTLNTMYTIVTNLFHALEWYNAHFKFLQGYQDMISDPCRVFNADESGFPICGKSNKVLAPTGSKYVYQVLPGDKTQITVMACFYAFGKCMSPLIVYPGERFQNTVLSNFQNVCSRPDQFIFVNTYH